MLSKHVCVPNFRKNGFQPGPQAKRTKFRPLECRPRLSRVPPSRPYRVAPLRGPRQARGLQGGRLGTLAAEVSQKRRPYSCRGLGASVRRGNLNAFTHFCVPNFRKSESWPGRRATVGKDLVILSGAGLSRAPPSRPYRLAPLHSAR